MTRCRPACSRVQASPSVGGICRTRHQRASDFWSIPRLSGVAARSPVSCPGRTGKVQDRLVAAHSSQPSCRAVKPRGRSRIPCIGADRNQGDERSFGPIDDDSLPGWRLLASFRGRLGDHLHIGGECRISSSTRGVLSWAGHLPAANEDQSRSCHRAARSERRRASAASNGAATSRWPSGLSRSTNKNSRRCHRCFG